MKKYGHLVYLVGALVGLLATVVIFLPIVGANDTTFTGLNLILSEELIDFGTFANGRIAFNLLNLLAFILPLVAAATLVFVKKGHRYAFLGFLAALVFVLLIPEVTQIRIEILGNPSFHNVDWSMQIGLILGIVFNAIGLVITLFQNVLDFKR